MKFSNSKKLVSILMCLIMLFGMAIPVIANSAITNMDIDNYVQNVAEANIGSIVPNVSASDSFYLSQGFKVEGNPDPNSRTYFFFRNGNCIGNIVATYINGQYASTSSIYDNPIATAALKTNEPLNLLVDGDSVYIMAGGAGWCLYGPNFGEDVHALKSPRTAVGEAIELSEIPFNNYKISPLATTGELILDVPHVNNGTDLQGQGLCWAASIASIVSYRKSLSLSAMDVYDAVVEKYDPSIHGYPVGNYEHELHALNGCYGMSYIRKASGLAFETVVSKIKLDHPIFAGLESTVGTRHAVVICGYISSIDVGYKYVIMDPNVRSYQYGTVYSSTSTNFDYYITPEKTYNQWWEAYY